MLQSISQPKPPRNARCILAIALLCAAPGWGARPYRGGVVASPHPLASQAALLMLDRGGNAVDAAVSAAFTLAVVDPAHSGLGGGGLALLHEVKQEQTRALDFREVAPAGANRDMYVRDGKLIPKLATDGALAVATPGAVAGYFELLSKHGRLPPRVVLGPAIRAAEVGFPVTPQYQRLARDRLDCLRSDQEASRIFLRPNQDRVPDVPPLGTEIRQPELARTLTLLARTGPRAFYAGRIASAIESSVRRGGGILTARDLLEYRVIWRQPLEGTYRGHRILVMPPPSAGGLAVLQVLGVLELRQPSGIPYGDPNAIHIYAEALRRAFVDRVNHLGDPGFVQVPLEKLSSHEHIAQIAESIDLSRATPSASLAMLPSKDPTAAGQKHTAHVSTLDRAGNAVALTTTVNDGFGACLVAQGTGILLNDQMDDFATRPFAPNVYELVTGEENAIAPGKRPLSSMSPTLVFQAQNWSRVMMAVGAAGGPTIVSSVILAISNVIDQRMGLIEAIGHGRVHHQFLPDELRLERHALDVTTLKALEAKGHRIQLKEAWGDAEAVMEDQVSGLRYGASDPRREGAAMGQD